jgi:hypothetical protein
MFNYHSAQELAKTGAKARASGLPSLKPERIESGAFA